MEKIIKILDSITSIRPDLAKHMVGGVYSMWYIMVAYIVGGKTVGIIASLAFILLFILWEVYNMKKHKKPFSITDIMAAFIPMVPFLIMLVHTQ
jgi:hypothetical protein